MGPKDGNTRQRILVIRFSSLGDLVLMIPLLRTLKDGYSGHNLELVTKKKYSPLFKAITWIDKVHELEQDSFPALVDLVSKLNRERFDLIVDAHDVLRSRFVSMMIRGPKKVRLQKDQLKKTLLIKSGRNLFDDPPSMVERYLEIASRIGLPAPPPGTLVELPDRLIVETGRKLADAGLSQRRLVAVAPGSRWPAKRWPIENFALLTGRLVDSGFSVVLIGDSSERDLCGRLATDSPFVFNSAGTTDVPGTAAILSASDCLVTNDSAPLHLAEMMGTPVVALFGPTVREFGFYPRLEKSILVERDCECRPCSRNGSKECKFGTTECLSLIDSDEVYRAVVKVLGSGSTAQATKKAE